MYEPGVEDDRLSGPEGNVYHHCFHLMGVNAIKGPVQKPCPGIITYPMAAGDDLQGPVYAVHIYQRAPYSGGVMLGLLYETPILVWHQ